MKVKRSVKFVGSVALCLCLCGTFSNSAHAQNHIGNRNFNSSINLAPRILNKNINLRLGDPLVTADGFEYEIDNDTGNVTITKYTGNATNVTVPATIDGHNVTIIGPNAFQGCIDLENINMPNSLISIESNAFYCCYSLTNITIPINVTTIGSDAFSRCSSLVQIQVDVDSNYFSSENGILFSKDKSSLICFPAGKTDTSYVMPNSVTRIESSAFFGCTNLTNISLSDNLASICNYAFFECENLENLSIPSSVVDIQSYVFTGCKSLEWIHVDAENNNFLSEDDILFNKDKSELLRYPARKSGTKYAVPTSVTTISSYAFNACENLETIAIPNSVTFISPVGVVFGCTNLQKIICAPDSAAETYANTENIPYETDDVAPTLSLGLSPEQKTNGNVTATITSNEEVQPVAGWTLAQDHKSLSKTYNANTTENILVTDLVGNASTINVVVSNIDKVAPALSVSYSPTNITNGNVTITITSNEEIQAVNGWTLAQDHKSLTKTYTANASESVQVKDLAGNTSTANIVISNIDKSGPVLSISYSPEQNTTGTVTATITSDEEIQAVEGWVLAQDHKSLSKSYDENTTEDVEVSDLLGNTSTANVVVANIDKIAPILNVSYSSEQKTNGTVTATITSNEKVQAVEGWILAQDHKSLSKTYAENTTEDIEIADLAGNTSIAHVIVSNIDKVAPILSVSYNPTERTNGPVEVIITSNEEIRPLASWGIAQDGKSLIKDYTSNTVENITVTDIAGNTATIEIRIENIGKPAVVGDLNGDGKTSISDLLIMKRGIIGSLSLTEENLAAFDLNGDGKLSASDLLILKRIIVGLN